MTLRDCPLLAVTHLGTALAVFLVMRAWWRMEMADARGWVELLTASRDGWRKEAEDAGRREAVARERLRHQERSLLDLHDRMGEFQAASEEIRGDIHALWLSSVRSDEPTPAVAVSDDDGEAD